MKAEELLRLMIGDILMAYYDDGETQSSFPVKVDGLDENYTLVDGECCISWKPMLSSDINEEYADELNPIPLTAEILEKNGFERRGCISYHKPHIGLIIHHWNDDLCFLNYSKKNIPPIMIPFHYVHELQRALRSCGLWELADNFKV